MLEAELGAPVEQVFAEFDWEPLAAASIGQTYRARLHSGEPVVVKVQRPDIEALMERDLAALALLADLAQRRTPFGQGVRSGEMLAQFADGLRAELDFRHEADAMSEMAMLLHERSTVRIPKVYRERVGPPGARAGALRGVHRLSDTRHLDDAAVDRAALADQLLRATLDQVMRIGLFHADPHPGNVFALPDGTLGLIDFGAVGRLDPIQQSADRRHDGGARPSRREPAARRCRAGRRPRRHDVARAARAGARPADGRARPARVARVDPAVLAGPRGDAVALRHAAADRRRAAVAGARHRRRHAARALPRHLPRRRGDRARRRRATASPSSIAEQLARDELLAMVPHLRRLPERVDRILTPDRARRAPRAQHRRRGQPADRPHARQPPAARARRDVVPVTSAWLLVAADDGPQVAGETGLFDVFGYGGLLLGVVLVLRVVAAVARDGTT